MRYLDSVAAKRVVPGWAVFDGIAQRSGGDVIDVKPDVAADWIAAGWVEPVTPRRKSVRD